MRTQEVNTHMKFKQLFAAAIVVALAACGAPAPQTASNISVKDAWARPTPDTAEKLSAAYMIIENTGGADKLLAASGDVAGMIQIHQTKDSGGMMMMEEMKDGVDVPANSALELKPGGYHVMLMGVRQDLKPGDTFKLTLKFNSGKEIPVDVTVREP